MKKRADAFRSIGEVATLIGVAPHVLRYWETQFSQLRPMKRADGRRYYRPDDILLAAGLCEALRDDGLTIRGAKKLISADRGAKLRVRGAARLGKNSASGDDVEIIETARAYAAAPARATEPAQPAEVRQPAAAAARPRPRKPVAETPPTLPLFPEFETPAPAVGKPEPDQQSQVIQLVARLKKLDHLPRSARATAVELRDACASFIR